MKGVLKHNENRNTKWYRMRPKNTNGRKRLRFDHCVGRLGGGRTTWMWWPCGGMGDLWLASNQQNMAKVTECNSHDFVMFCKTPSCWSTPSTHIPYWLNVLASHVVSPWEQDPQVAFRNWVQPQVVEGGFQPQPARCWDPSPTTIRNGILPTT